MTQDVDIEGLMRAAIGALGPSLEPSVRDEVEEYVDAAEFGVGWELLWFVVNRDTLDCPDALIAAGKAMGFDVTEPD